MYFKSIEMAGFKSFVDPTKITFGEGITSIVGPNGCGKSNISDGIRWVLGEQRAKMLRGTKMEDFIFSGSTNRKQSGMAEVTLTIAGIDGKLSREELKDFNEVSVTRRLYRSGESEYLINKTPCRLKDLVDLFLDTGISTRAFSIIEQDQVMRIVTSKPEDRRYIIEEAAGIMKYKHKRHEALNKLANSRTNLERVTDIVSELERQKNSLKRQANKAERYKTIKVEMEELFRATSADEWKNLKHLGTTINGQVKRLEEERTKLEEDISNRKTNLVNIQSTLDSQTEELARLKEEEYRITSMVENNNGKIKLYTERIAESDELAERRGIEVVDLEKQSENMKAELVSKNEIIAQKESEELAKAGELDIKKKEHDSHKLGLNQMGQQITEKEKAIADMVADKAAKNNELVSNKTKIEILEGRRQKTLEDQQVAQSAFAEVKERKDKKETSIREAQSRFDLLLKEVNELESRRSSLLESRTELESNLSDLKTTVTENSTRLESFQEMEKAHEGYQEGIKSLLDLKDKNHDVAKKFRGTLVEKVKVSKEYEAGIETVLGHRLEALLVGKANDAIEVIDLLHKDKLGRATLLTVEMDGSNRSGTVPTGDGIIGKASDLVSVDSDLKPLIDRLLNGVLFVESLEKALKVPSRNGFTFVTPRGDMVDHSGVISGGTKAKTGGGMLERKRMIEELGKTVTENRKNLESLQNEYDKVKTDLANVEKGKDEKEKILKQEEHNLINERKDFESLTRESDRQDLKVRSYQSEIESMDREKDHLSLEISRLETSIEKMKEKRAAIGQELDNLANSTESSRGSIAQLAESIASMEVAVASIMGELNVAKAERDRIQNSVTDIDIRAERMRSDIEASQSKKKSMIEEIETSKEEITNGLERKEALSARLIELSNKLAGDKGGKEEGESGIKTTEESLDQTREALSEAKIKQSETALRLETLIDKVHEQDLTEEDLEYFDTSGYDMDEANAKMAELKDIMHRYGDVNLSAIDDYNQVMERLTFLTTQRDDLIESINDIRKVIDKLNRTTKQLFLDAYTKISTNFRDVFKRLFNGGEAEMILTDESNILESGLEIMVRPPGKKRQNLTLLSAGEKAMTAMAVLFSVFMVMPSPFCLLDEVDAPLDEANIGRFKAILKDFSATTQFLVITHNQKTMAFADRLYGITMQQPGISQILSVDMVQTDTVSPEELAATPSA